MLEENRREPEGRESWKGKISGKEEKNYEAKREREKSGVRRRELMENVFGRK